MKKKTDFMDLYISEKKKENGSSVNAGKDGTVPSGPEVAISLIGGIFRTVSLIAVTLLAAVGIVALVLDVTREPLLSYFSEVFELIKNIF